MRWLYVPNEAKEGDQIGTRMAFEKFDKAGIFSAYLAYSYFFRQDVLGNHQNALDEFLETTKEFGPDVIFIQHPGDNYPMDREFLQKLKNVPSKPKLVLYEEDPYGYIVKPMNATFLAVVAESDMCFLGGTGYIADMVRKAGAKIIRFATHSWDNKRFGTPWEPTRSRRYDAVMIANLTCLKRVPWLFMPGGRSRKNTAEILYKHFGSRFAVYGAGQGWEGKAYCQGPIAYEKQGELIRDSWMSVNWGQFDEIAMYSSDRMPISLACGVPHITNYQSGYEHLFQNIPGFFIIKQPKEARDVALYLLSLPIDKRNELGYQAAEYAHKHLEVTDVYGDIVTVTREQFFTNVPVIS